MAAVSCPNPPNEIGRSRQPHIFHGSSRTQKVSNTMLDRANLWLKIAVCDSRGQAGRRVPAQTAAIWNSFSKQLNDLSRFR